MAIRHALVLAISLVTPATILAAGPRDDCGAAAASLHLPPFGRTSPPRARVIPFCEFLALVSSGAAQPISREIVEDQREAALRLDIRNRLFIEGYLAAHPDATEIRGLVDDRPRRERGFAPNGDGNWRSTLPDGREVITLGRRAMLQGLADSIRLGSDRVGELDVYRSFYDALPAALIDPATGGVLPSPASLADAPLAEIQTSLRQMADLWAQVEALEPPIPPVPPGTCGSEEGASGVWGDDRYVDQDGFNAKFFQIHDGFGLFANFAFPNKPFLGCVRDQARRGSCVAFGVVSATEMSIARATGSHVNLSEQDVWEHYNLALWGGNPVWYGESGTGKTVVAGIAATGYRIPYEAAWDYNPSLSRTTTLSGFYQHSCDAPYPSSEPCSNTTPQAPLVCALDPQTGNVDCALVDAGIPGSPHTITSGVSFWTDDREASTSALRLALSMNLGVQIGFAVTDAFMNRAFRQRDGNGGFVDNPYGGYVPFDLNDLGTGGEGHAVHVVGFIRNEDIQLSIPGAPLAPREGYFIIRNSYGPAWGDAGYAYLPWDYVKARAFEAVAVSGVQ